jgi:hypothetical protein
MVLQNDILKEWYQKLAPSFLWKGQWISADKWTKYIKASKGMESANVQDVNRVLKRLAVSVDSFAVKNAAPPTLYVNNKKIKTQAEKKDNDKVWFETKRKVVQFYYISKEKGDIPPCPLDAESWGKFYDNNKISKSQQTDDYETSTSSR